MPFLSPNQKHQNTEGNYMQTSDLLMQQEIWQADVLRQHLQKVFLHSNIFSPLKNSTFTAAAIVGKHVTFYSTECIHLQI